MAEPPSATRETRTVARSGGAAAGRGIALIALAVAIGVLLLSKGLDDGGLFAVDSTSPAVATPVDDETELADPSPTSVVVEAPVPTTVVAPVARNPAEVKIFVVNGNGVAGIAKANVDALKPAGYNVLAPGNTTERPAATMVYFADGWQLEAFGVAGSLGIPSEQVALWPDPAPFDPNTATVVVVLGADGLGVQPS